MNTAAPIRREEDVTKLKDYYKTQYPNTRNYVLVVIGLNTALRISDILELRWKDVYHFSGRKFREHISVVEQKTEKASHIFMNRNILEALASYKEELEKGGDIFLENRYLFENKSEKSHPISRVQAYRIIKKCADECGISGVVSCHSLRKTFGYYAWKQGVQPALLMDIYNHSSFRITQRYLGIEQDDRDQIFKTICL